MSLANKAKNKGEELKGQAKEPAGQATGDEDLRAEGEVDEVKGNLKQAGEKSRTRSSPSASARRLGRALSLGATRELPAEVRIGWQPA